MQRYNRSLPFRGTSLLSHPELEGVLSSPLWLMETDYVLDAGEGKADGHEDEMQMGWVLPLTF